MKRIAIIGAGIAGLSAAYELARQQQAGAAIEFTLFEASNRLGGIVETVRQDAFVIECGPDSWVSEKPWARELAVELGLESQLIFSQDQHRRTYVAEGGKLQALPDGMRLMVPVDLDRVLASPLFSPEAKRDYQRELQRASDLKATALDAAHPSLDESVNDFVSRHFGGEVANTIAAPLLAGVFGGDIAALSARAVLPALVALEREHGSLILGLQQRKRATDSDVPIFTSLRYGVASLIGAMESRIPAGSIRRSCPIDAIELEGERWRIGCGNPLENDFDAALIATPAKITMKLLGPLDRQIPELLPQQSSSAILVAFAFSPEQNVRIPQGFGFLVAQREPAGTGQRRAPDSPEAAAQRALLACTFVDQKFPDRAPRGAVLLRVFFGGAAAPELLQENDAALERLAHAQLERILGRLPHPIVTVTRRWPDSLPLYAVGHLERMAEMESRTARFPGLRLIGNAYRGVGLPDVIREARNAARAMVQKSPDAEARPREKMS